MVLILAALGTQAQVTAWRPFRPGLVYAFRTAKADSVFTLRVDSVYAVGSDSVYRFNRMLRVLARLNRYVLTTNNLFGARMQFRPSTGAYTFYLDADALGAARQWTLQAGTREGQEYRQPATPAVVTRAVRRQLQAVAAGVTDSVLTLRTSPDEDSLVFSRRYGALQLPRGLYRSQRGSRPLYLAELPVPVSESRYYAPTRLFDFQPGDELGFQQQELVNPFPCSVAFVLRRIMTRQQSVDSLIYTYLEQTRYQATNAGAPGCGMAGATRFTPVSPRRLAISLRTGRSPQVPFLGLLTNEYRREAPDYSTIQAGLPILTTSEGGCVGTGPRVGNVRLSRTSSLPGEVAAFQRLSDGASLAQIFTAGVGEIQEYDLTLAYSRRQLLTGQVVICGKAFDFSTLLASRPAQAAAAATLYPNPATQAATLALAAPARSGTWLTLTDALGRRAWSAPVAAGQTTAAISLAGLPAGLYLVQLTAPGAVPRTWKLLAN